MGAVMIPESVRDLITFHVSRVERIAETIARVNRYTGEYHAECETRAYHAPLSSSGDTLREISALARARGAALPASVPRAIAIVDRLRQPF